MPAQSAPFVAIRTTNGKVHTDGFTGYPTYPSPALRTEITEFGAGAVSLRVCGDIDAMSVARLQTQLGHLLSQSPATLVLDVSEVSFLSARGLAALLEARETAVRAGVDLRLVCGNRAVSRPLEATGFDRLFTCCDRRAKPIPRQRNGG